MALIELVVLSWFNRLEKFGRNGGVQKHHNTQHNDTQHNGLNSDTQTTCIERRSDVCHCAERAFLLLTYFCAILLIVAVFYRMSVILKLYNVEFCYAETEVMLSVAKTTVVMLRLRLC
jgi:hypothetical protein